GNNAIQGGPGRDLIFGHHVVLDRTTHLGNFTSPLYQDLTGTLLYDTDIPTEGNLLTDGLPQLDPRGHASWGDYLITLVGNSYGAPAAYYGNNYIAGAGGNDMIFDELGNGTIQGGGSIDYVSQPYVSMTGFTSFGSASSCMTGGHPGKTSVLWRVGACRDASNALLINPSVDRTTDAGSYIEGGGGDNVIFGNGGPNDIVGGSSDFFGTAGACSAANEVAGAAGTCARPSGSNLIFTGSGTQLDRDGSGDL